MAKVTFLMMAYNTEKYIEKAVRSVLNQTEPDINIYIRNNGSTDKTTDILKQLEKEDSRVHVVFNEINGLTTDGIKPFQQGWWYYDENNLGEYISIIDSDDYLEPNFVEVLYNNAKQNDSDLVVAGCNFVNEIGEICGIRNVLEVVTDNLNVFGNYFPYLYNCMRTWWGKLFKKEFFFNNYDKAWTPTPFIWYQEPIWWKMDTCIMLDYLSCNPKLSCIDKPFYNFLVRNNSNYNIRVPHARFLLEAYTVYMKGMQILKMYQLDSPENVKFMQSIHWAYITEVLPVKIENQQLSVEDWYAFLEDVVNDTVNAVYQAQKFPDILLKLKPILEKIETQNLSQNFNIYSSFMARLSKCVDILDADNSNPLAIIVILSVLCDLKNRHMFGETLLLMPFETKSLGFKKSLEFQHQIRKWWTLHPCMWVDYINSIDNNEELESLENKMIEYYKNNKHEEVLSTATEILEHNPVNIKGLVCVMLTARKIDDNILFSLISASISVIWENNIIENMINEIEGG